MGKVGARPRAGSDRSGGWRVEDSDAAVAEFDGWLRDLMEGQGSDLHVKVGSPPMIRLSTGLRRLDRDPITPMETAAIAESIVPKDRPQTRAQNREVDFTHSLKDVGTVRAALRQDPDVILIGEMRDTETVRAAIQAAETGHLVLSTLHTVDAAETVNRVIDFFPPYQQTQVRLALAGTLRGLVCQRLVSTIDGGRIPALEVLVNAGRVAERIADPEKTSEIKDVVADGAFYGMMTFDQSLLALLQEGKITTEAAFQAVSSRHDFELAMQQVGLPLPV